MNIYVLKYKKIIIRYLSEVGHYYSASLLQALGLEFTLLYDCVT